MTDIERKFKAVIKDFPEYSMFLAGSYLVVTHGSSQFAFKKQLTVQDITERIVLIRDSEHKEKLVRLHESLEEVLALGKRAQKQEGQSHRDKIKQIEDAMSSFPLDELEFHDDFDIQIIFPGVSDAIQKVKEHPLVNQSKTCMCGACIRVFLF
jgi:hypothetical protein